MIDTGNFEKIEPTPSGGNGKALSHKQGVIKSDQIKLAPSRKVETKTAERSTAGAKDKETLEPLFEDGEICGVRFTCACGRVTQIMFEYSKT